MGIMESLQTLVISESTLQLIHEGKICRAVGCYQPLTDWEIQKKRRVCRKHHLASEIVRYHCTMCGVVIYDNNRGNLSQGLCNNCIHEAKMLRHREYYAKFVKQNSILKVLHNQGPSNVSSGC